MPKSYSNGLGIVALAIIVAATPLVPAAASSPLPQWVWDADGRVTDASGQYVRVETPQGTPPPLQYALGGEGDEGGGGCK